MIAAARNVFSASDCPVNTYGVAAKMYGLAAAPCKPCPRNMITDGALRVNSSDACINPDGFGYASEGEPGPLPTLLQFCLPIRILAQCEAACAHLEGAAFAPQHVKYERV
jgi:hypothetical protein